MAESRTTIWYEDVERHRQPSLYYLSSEDDPGGPHLIVDWNGPPTDFNEFDFDIMSKFIEMKPIDTQCNYMIEKQTPATKPLDHDTEQGIFTPRSGSASSTILTENDGANLHFLTVPPMVNSLLKRLIANQAKNRPTTIPEESTLHEVDSTDSEIRKNHKTLIKRGRPAKKERPQQSCQNPA